MNISRHLSFTLFAKTKNVALFKRLTDGEWQIIQAFLARSCKVGRPHKRDDRDIWSASQYIASTGYKSNHLPIDYVRFTTVQYHFYRLPDSGLLDFIYEALVVFMRLIEGGGEQPRIGIIDSHFIKIVESGVVGEHDAGKKIKGRKRYIITGNAANLLDVIISSAHIQDCEGAVFIIDLY